MQLLGLPFYKGLKPHRLRKPLLFSTTITTTQGASQEAWNTEKKKKIITSNIFKNIRDADMHRRIKASREINHLTRSLYYNTKKPKFISSQFTQTHIIQIFHRFIYGRLPCLNNLEINIAST